MGPSTRSSTQDKQARIDRSGAAEGQAESSSPSSGQGSPATLLDLSDAHGLIYQLLPDSQSRAAFRQCSKTIYMSPSINAHLKALNFGSIEWRAQPLHRKKGSSKRYGTREKWDSDKFAPRTIKDAIVKFPKHAILKQLHLISSYFVKINFRNFLSKAEALDPVSEATRRRLRTVNSVHTQADCLNFPDAERLTSLLPQLEELRLQDSPYSSDVFGTLAAGQCNITSLELCNCKSSEGPGTAMEGVSLMTSLRSLKLDSIASGTQLSPLTRLQNLKHLSVSNFRFAGLGHVVSSLPVLETLDMVRDRLNCWSLIILPPGEHLASTTLTTLGIRGDLSHHSDWLLELDFPCLSFLHFKSAISLSLYGSPVSQEVLDRVERVAGWLGRQGLTWIGEVDSFCMSCTTYNYDQARMSASFCAALFKRLFVMAHQFGNICKLRLDDIKLSHASLSDIATLFPHVSHLTFSRLGLCSPLELPELLASLPLLKSVQVNGGLHRNMWEEVNGVKAVLEENILTLLCAARDGCRELSLRVFDIYGQYQRLKAAWEAEACKHPLYTPVRLLKATDTYYCG